MALSPATVRKAWEVWLLRHRGHELHQVLGTPQLERRLRAVFQELPTSMKLVLAAAGRKTAEPKPRRSAAPREVTWSEWTPFEVEHRAELGLTTCRELVALHRSIHGPNGPLPPREVREAAQRESEEALARRKRRMAAATAQLIAATTQRRVGAVAEA